MLELLATLVIVLFAIWLVVESAKQFKEGWDKRDRIEKEKNKKGEI